jgi:integrase
VLLERWKATLKLSNRSVAKYLVILHGIFRRAMKVWGLSRNPVSDVERPRYRVSDDLDAFSTEEVWALARALRWRDVDLGREAIRVRRSYNAHGGLTTPKSGKVRSVPMVSDVARTLAAPADRDRFTGEQDLVFPGEFGLSGRELVAGAVQGGARPRRAAPAPLPRICRCVCYADLG